MAGVIDPGYKSRTSEGGEDVIRNNAASPPLINLALRTTRSPFD